ELNASTNGYILALEGGLPVWVTTSTLGSSFTDVDFTVFSTNYGETYTVTTSPLWIQNNLAVSSTSYLEYVSSTAMDVGTILSGVWNGTAIGDTYLDKAGDWTGTIDLNNFADGGVETGDLLYGSDTNVISELNASTNGYILALEGGLPVWVTTSTLGSSFTDVDFTVFSTNYGETYTVTTSPLWIQNNLAVSSTAYLDSMQVTGVSTFYDDISWPATTPTFTINAGEAVTIIAGSDSFIFDVDAGVGIAYAGSARPTRQVALAPEFAGATMTADGTNNEGTMTSDFCEQGVSAGIPDTNTNDCESATIHNYYKWTTASTTPQDYDIWIRWRVPDNFSDWPSNPITFQSRRTETTGSFVTTTVFDTAGAQEAETKSTGAANTWTDTSVAATFSGTYTAGSYMTLRIGMRAGTNQTVLAGEITINYLSKN
ncbi:MAG: hypothetical protein Q8O88_06155, partial [bacterium]|nr:hypothetical protein [bacterium]